MQTDSKTERRPLLRLFARFKEHSSAIVMATVMSAVVSLSEGARIFLVRDVLEALTDSPEPSQVYLLAIGIAVVTLLNGLAQAGRGWFIRQPAFLLMAEYRSALFHKVLNFPYASTHRYSSGDLAGRLTHDLGAVQQGQTVLLTLMQKPLTFMVLLGTALWHEPILTVLGLLFIPTLGLPVAHMANSLRGHARLSHREVGALNTRLQENLTGVRTIRAAGATELQSQRFSQQNEALLGAQLGALKARLLINPLVAGVAGLGAALVLAVSLHYGTHTSGSLVAFLLALGLLYDPLKSLTQVPLLIAQSEAGLQRVYEVLDEPEGPCLNSGERSLSPGPLSLQWRNIEVYLEGQRVLDDVSVDVQAGQLIAIVGPSGAGKSTLLNLIPRLLPADSGDLILDGHPINAIKLKALRESVALVAQETFLLHDTVLENVRLGRHIPEERIVDACELAGLTSLIKGLPKSYQTVVGDRGERLSGGERQRIALARALVGRGGLLLLDEATAHVDALGEAHLFKNLKNRGNWTVIVVTHRLESACHADLIYVLDKGQVVGQGTHPSLLEACELYRELWHARSRN